MSIFLSTLKLSKMDMGGMTMMPAPTGMPKAGSAGDMGDMDMGMGGGSSCKISVSSPSLTIVAILKLT